jgi:inhibitor of KinA sporulation pathway (predicted exonuclease)
MIYICIFDFEVTSYETNNYHEVIEITSILYKWDENYEYVSDFQQFCKPKNRPKLCNYCKYKTGITQKSVDDGLPFNQAIQKHYLWLESVCDINNVYIVTSGTWLLSYMALYEYYNYNMKNIPEIYLRFIDIKNEFAQFYNTNICSMKSMLKHLNIKCFKRTGIENCTNINNILMRMINDNYTFDDMDIIKIIISKIELIKLIEKINFEQPKN